MLRLLSNTISLSAAALVYAAFGGRLRSVVDVAMCRRDVWQAGWENGYEEGFTEGRATKLSLVPAVRTGIRLGP
ncbi:MAG: hypothetical protein ACT4QF_25465 [Sporichthyaceae bacterium]